MRETTQQSSRKKFVQKISLEKKVVKFRLKVMILFWTLGTQIFLSGNLFGNFGLPLEQFHVSAIKIKVLTTFQLHISWIFSFTECSFHFFVYQQCGIILCAVAIICSSWLTKKSCELLLKAGQMARRRNYEGLGESIMVNEKAKHNVDIVWTGPSFFRYGIKNGKIWFKAERVGTQGCGHGNITIGFSLCLS